MQNDTTTQPTSAERRIRRGRRTISEFERDIREEFARADRPGWTEDEYVASHRDTMIVRAAIDAVDLLAVVVAAAEDNILDARDRKILSDTLPELLATLDSLPRS